MGVVEQACHAREIWDGAHPRQRGWFAQSDDYAGKDAQREFAADEDAVDVDVRSVECASSEHPIGAWQYGCCECEDR